jgi:thiamine transporter
MKKIHSVNVVTEGAVMVAAALALSLLKIPIHLLFGGFGGSIDFAMVPLVFYAVRRGLLWGMAAGLICGTLQYFLEGVAYTWESIILDYSVAYAAVGLAGFFKQRTWGLVTGGLVGCFARFVVHFISGVVLYAEYMQEIFMGMHMPNVAVYSILYNSTYMLPNTILTLAAGAILTKPLHKYIVGEDLAR